MLEKTSTVGSDRRRKGRARALGPPCVPPDTLSLRAPHNPAPAYALAQVSVNREFFDRFLLDTHLPLRRRSTRHSDTSRNGRKFSRSIKTGRATRHLNATLVTRHSNAEITPVLRSLFLPSAPRLCSAYRIGLFGKARLERSFSLVGPFPPALAGGEVPRCTIWSRKMFFHLVGSER
jgi:hypothetical protein